MRTEQSLKLLAIFILLIIAAISLAGCSESALVAPEDTSEWANTANAFRGDIMDDEIDGLNLDNGWLSEGTE